MFHNFKKMFSDKNEIIQDPDVCMRIWEIMMEIFRFAVRQLGLC